MRPLPCSIRFLFVLALLSANGFAFGEEPAKPNTLTDKEIAEGWLLLFDGESLYGWRPESKANWQVKDGIISASEGEPGLLRTTTQFADYTLKVDFRHTAKTNSGIFVRTAPKVAKEEVATACYEVNIAGEGVSPFPTGNIVERKCRREQPEGSKTGSTADAWHTMEITARASRVEVSVDGKPVADFCSDENGVYRGFIGLQFFVDKIEFRNVKLLPIRTKPIFNGTDLTGWKPTPESKGTFTVKDGAIHGEGGNGSLETEKAYGDFVLQFEAKTGVENVNSGLFFRCIPGEKMNGYEAQINNTVKAGKPADCGTGGIFRRQDARKVNARDKEWFTMTIIGDGPHTPIWVNGLQVSDFSDMRPKHKNPRSGQRLEPGTLQIQGHDPGTIISLRNVRVSETPARK